MDTGKKASRFFVTGRVQGVGFRYFAVGEAERLSIAGYVRNLRDGRVEAYAIGTPEQLAQFRARLEKVRAFRTSIPSPNKPPTSIRNSHPISSRHQPSESHRSPKRWTI